MKNNFIKGTRVHYQPEHYKDNEWENGMVKSTSDNEHVFVVYNCAEEWHRFEEYTAARTNIRDLKMDWRMKHNLTEDTLPINYDELLEYDPNFNTCMDLIGVYNCILSDIEDWNIVRSCPMFQLAEDVITLQCMYCWSLGTTGRCEMSLSDLGKQNARFK